MAIIALLTWLTNISVFTCRPIILLTIIEPHRIVSKSTQKLEIFSSFFCTHIFQITDQIEVNDVLNQFVH